MKLLQSSQGSGTPRPRLLDGEGRARDVSSIVPDFGPGTFSLEPLDRLRTADPEPLPIVELPGTRLHPLIAQSGNIWCIGLNYSDHAAEAGLPVVGAGMRPPGRLPPGDEVTLRISGPGTQRSRLVPDEGRM